MRINLALFEIALLPKPWKEDQTLVESVVNAAPKRQVEIVAVPTEEACQLLQTPPSQEVYAILHVTC